MTKQEYNSPKMANLPIVIAISFFKDLLVIFNDRLTLLLKKGKRKMNDSTQNERKFSTKTRKEVWLKADTLKGHPEDIWRKDPNGKPMNWHEFLNPKCNNGWKIVYIVPLEKGGADDVGNMQAMNLHS